MSDLQQLQKRVANAPTSPGVYRWLNASGDVLYIGKAKNLKNRLKSYVQENPDKSIGPWKLSLIKHIADFDVTVTATELEALILETTMIKEVKPKYNVLMKDDKNYVYVKISTEEFPELSVVRQMEDDDATYFGPFLSAYSIKRTLDMLHELFAFRSCQASVRASNTGKSIDRGCMEYQIGQCNGLCVGEISKEQYCDRIAEVKKFLKGNHKDAVYKLKEMMDDAAAQQKFEKAGKLRDALMYIDSLGAQQIVSDTSRENTDAIGIALQNGKAQVVVLRERGGKLREERSLALSGEADSVSPALSEFIPQYYSIESDLPDLILIQDDIKDKDVLEAWLKEVRGKRVEIRSPERGKKSKLLAMAEVNAKNKIEQQFAKWEAASKNIASALEDLRDVLHLKDIPKRIEGYDISHLGGTETVGSMVVIKNGKPTNKEYRSFTLRTVKEGEIDDYKALKEVLRRRLKYLTNEAEKWKEEGTSIRKARKSDVEEGQEYKNMFVAENNTEIVGKIGLQKAQITPLWIDDSFTETLLAETLVQTLCKKQTKGKLYIGIPAEQENAYARLGFRYVREVPSAVKIANDHICMMYEAAKNKPDASLTSTPDLLVIDGGKGQLSAIVDVLKEYQLKIPVVGLAKREEEVFLPGASLPIDLPNNSEASFLLQRLRNEAHRFANAHREKRLEKRMFQ